MEEFKVVFEVPSADETANALASLNKERTGRRLQELRDA